jgi:hypothetical protein
MPLHARKTLCRRNGRSDRKHSGHYPPKLAELVVIAIYLRMY